MRFPDFLIIGAMKSGTTTLYRDLLTNPRVFMSTPKEPHNLCDDRVLTDSGRAEYAALFRAASTDQIAGEASTGYTKLPDHPGVPERAKAVLGADFKAIYIVREPVSRAISHHTHANASGVVTEPVDEAIRKYPMFINWGLYAMQITPWLEAFGPDRVRIVRFESYVRDRAAGVDDICRFLGIEPRPDLIEKDKVFNRSDGKVVGKGVFGKFRKTGLYRSVIRPLLPISARDRLRDALLPQAPPKPAPPTLDTVDYLIARLAPDAERLATLLSHDGPLWNFDDVRRSFTSPGRDTAALQAVAS